MIVFGILLIVWFIGLIVTGPILLWEPINAFLWPITLLIRIWRILPGAKLRGEMKKAYLEGKEDMYYATLENPMDGRCDKKYMNHKNNRIYEAYIKGGNEVLAQKAEEAAGISLSQLRRASLVKSDQARMKQVELMKQARQEMMSAPEDKWLTEYNQIAKS